MSAKLYLNNDWVEVAGPIRGIDPDNGEEKLLHSTAAVGYFTNDPLSTTPIGALSVDCPEIGTTGKYPVFFDGATLATQLGAYDDHDIIFRVIEAPGDFRVVDAVMIEKVRPSN